MPSTWAKSRGLRVRDAKMPSGSRYRSDEAKEEKTKPQVRHEDAIRRIGFRRRAMDTPVAWSVNPFRIEGVVVVDFVMTSLGMLSSQMSSAREHQSDAASKKDANASLVV